MRERERAVVDLVRHVERNSFLKHCHGGVCVTTEGGNVHQSATIVRPTRHVRMELVNEQLDDRRLTTLRCDVQCSATNLHQPHHISLCIRCS